ncbi:MAG TPA: response regulator, partial [Ignavibacteriaceae bacterium]|nr:response regulator [Ignavibacteriaceae bacterium]
ENYKTLEAENGLKAMIILKALKPDLIISDLDIGETDSSELPEFIRASQRVKHIPVIFLASKHQDVKKKFDMDAYRYLLKPFNSSDLLSSIEILLKKIIKENE